MEKTPVRREHELPARLLSAYYLLLLHVCRFFALGLAEWDELEAAIALPPGLSQGTGPVAGSDWSGVALRRRLWTRFQPSAFGWISSYELKYIYPDVLAGASGSEGASLLFEDVYHCAVTVAQALLSGFS